MNNYSEKAQVYQAEQSEDMPVQFGIHPIYCLLFVKHVLDKLCRRSMNFARSCVSQDLPFIIYYIVGLCRIVYTLLAVIYQWV